MTVDHKAMREALDKATPGPWKYNALINGYGVTSAGVYFEQVAFVAENSGVKKDREQAKNNAIVIANAIEWLRQLLDENQAKAERIEKLEAMYSELHVKDFYDAEAQAKEIERLNNLVQIIGGESIDEIKRLKKQIEQLKIERDNLKATIEGCKGIEDYYRIQCRLWECLADKAAAVEALRWIAETSGNQELRLIGCPSMARTTLQRIESGESK